MEDAHHGMLNSARMGIPQGRTLMLLKLVVMVSILLATFALPTVRAEEVPDVIGLTQSCRGSSSCLGSTEGRDGLANHEFDRAGRCGPQSRSSSQNQCSPR